MTNFCDAGEAPTVKSAVHGATGILLAMMAVYNGTAWYHRRETHLLVNTVVYSAMTLFEAYQVLRHCR